jgi:hypothetical protein
VTFYSGDLNFKSKGNEICQSNMSALAAGSKFRHSRKTKYPAKHSENAFPPGPLVHILDPNKSVNF